MEMLFEQGETIENYTQILEEYEKAYEIRKANVEKLYEEIKIIKKLKV